jgi:hypothetical protein
VTPYFAMETDANNTETSSAALNTHKRKKHKDDVIMKDDNNIDVRAEQSTRAMKKILEDPVRWQIVAEVLENLAVGQVPQSLDDNIAINVGITHNLSMRQVQRVWKEYYFQHHTNTNKEVHMIGSGHLKVLEHQQDEEQDEEKQVSENHRPKISEFYDVHHFKDRIDVYGKVHPFNDVLKMILNVNDENPGAPIRGLMGKILEKHHIHIPRSSLSDIINVYIFETMNSYMKPMLRRINKLKRLIYCFEKINLNVGSTADNHGILHLQFYKDRYKREVYLDEKNFYLDVIKRKMRYSSVQLSHPDSFRYREVQNKNKIPHLMFIAALGMPQMSPDDTSYFNGKIGCWPFAELWPAKKNSKNRKRGTLEIKGVYCNSDNFFEIMTEKGGLLQTIREKLPWFGNDPPILILRDEELPPDHDDAVEDDTTILMVMDNAKPHVGKVPGSVHKKNIERLVDWARDNSVNVHFGKQPPQSPDFNLLDASLFRSLSRAACNYSIHAKNIDELFYNVQRTFEVYDEDNIVRAIAFQFATFIEVLKANGGNDFQLPHSHIRVRQNSGKEVIDFNVPKSVAQSAVSTIISETEHFALDAQSKREQVEGRSATTIKIIAESDEWNQRVKKWRAISATLDEL